jgi:sulfhydrogenase subunit beta (sulfur reductase)
MEKQNLSTQDQVLLASEGLQKLLEALLQKGYRVLGPTLRDDAIVYDDVSSLEELPRGWTDEQDGGTYRLKKRPDDALFGYVVGPSSLKRYLFLPVELMWQGRRNGNGIETIPQKEDVPRLAFIGARPCELAALAVQDKVFLEGPYGDSFYKRRREGIFIVAVNCSQAAKTCLCGSMNTGPKASSGFDLALTEVRTEEPRFVLEIGSTAGAEIMSGVPHAPARNEDIQAAKAISDRTAGSMTRSLDTREIRNLLYGNAEHPNWEAVAKRCLSCANCTLVCPTCFCHTVEDVTDLSGQEAARWRKWDSCFNLEFSFIHGGCVRASTMSRYRQWLTHKLASWIDQFGVSGCVGCGRCITWCPVGIDLTEEIRKLREATQ